MMSVKRELVRLRKLSFRMLAVLAAIVATVSLYLAQRAGLAAPFMLGPPESSGILRTIAKESKKAPLKSCAEVILNLISEKTFFHELRLPTDGTYRSRPGHWFHFSEYHVPMHAKLRRVGLLPKGKDYKTIVLRVPQSKWITDMNPMTRLYLSAAYSDGGARNILFVPPDVISKTQTGMVFDDVRLLKLSWLSSTFQSLQEKFVLNALKDCTKQQLEGLPLHLDASNIGTSNSKSNLLLGANKAPIYSWLSQPEEAESFRGSIQKLCDASHSKALQSLVELPPSFAEAQCLLHDVTDKRHAVIYQRDRTRKFIHFDEMKERIGQILGAQWTVSVIIHNDGNPPCLIVQCLTRADLLITPHGFQSMLNMFLPRKSYMIEVFPTRYYWSGYKSLGLAWDVQHAWAQSAPLTTLAYTLASFTTTDFCMQIFYCRYLARKGNVLMDETGLAQIQRVRNIIENIEETTAIELSGVIEREQCLRECGHDSKCASFSFESHNLSSSRCIFRQDLLQGESGNDQVGTGVNNKRCWSPGCK
mmetsp:Transcript_7749/g.25674  ORF Transcript_7749/g.25674 Transcript_7749/m.25674 type:complete len:532 (+) Transcript_7749:108-1703(+)